MDYDHLRTQRKGAVIPSGLLATYSENKEFNHQGSGEQDSHSFEDELEEWLSIADDVPESLQDSVNAILEKRILPDQIVSSKALDFYDDAMRCLRDVNEIYLAGLDSADPSEYTLGIYLKLFFILGIEYGSELAISKLLELWNLLNENSKLWTEVLAYIRYLVSSVEYPLSCISNQSAKTVLSRHLSIKTRDIISHGINQEKARKIFN